MLSKSLTMFNFSNIGNSLYDLYLSQLGHYVTHDPTQEVKVCSPLSSYRPNR